MYSVAERGEWYARQMYVEGHPSYLHHLEHYGHPSKFGYKDMVPLWKAEKWEPDRLVASFKKAGARYFAPCAVHHDNFDLWNSKHHRWNSVNMGPHRDIIGEWREAALKHGLRFGVTTHLARLLSWFSTNKGADSSGDMKGVPYDGNDPEYSDFYFEPYSDINRRHPLNAPESWRTKWALRIKDLIDYYHIDHLYFDGAIPFLGEDNGQTGMEVIAHLYNHSIEMHGGNQEAVMCIKRGRNNNNGIYVNGVSTLDLEGSVLDEIQAQPWQTDTSIGPWGYRKGEEYRQPTELIHELVDIVSKNGNVLLNVPPKADGTLDDTTERILTAIGAWMEVNGAAIYDTRPWTEWGGDGFRFTRKADRIYVIFLEWPRSGILQIPGLGQQRGVGRFKDVTLLGYDGGLRWGQDIDYDVLRVILPEKKPCEHAWTLQLTL